MPPTVSGLLAHLQQMPRPAPTQKLSALGQALESPAQATAISALVISAYSAGQLSAASDLGVDPDSVDRLHQAFTKECPHLAHVSPQYLRDIFVVAAKSFPSLFRSNHDVVVRFFKDLNDHAVTHGGSVDVNVVYAMQSAIDLKVAEEAPPAGQPRSAPRSFRGKAYSAGGAQQRKRPADQATATPRHREICRQFASSSGCPRGKTCHFAHSAGLAQLNSR